MLSCHFCQSTCSRQPPSKWTLPHQSRWCTPFYLPREVLVIAHLSAESHSRQVASIRAPLAPGFVPSCQLYPARVLCIANQKKVGMPLRYSIGYILSSTSLALGLMAIACLSTNNFSGSSTSTTIHGTNVEYHYAVCITQCAVLKNCCSCPPFASKQVSHLANMATGLTTPTSLSCISITYIILPRTPMCSIISPL